MFMNYKSLYKGTSFGELALINSQRRAARCRCSEMTYLGVLDKRDYGRIVS